METEQQSNTEFERLAGFVSRQPAFDEAFSCLKKTAEISIKVPDQNCVLNSVDNTVKLLRENTRLADVEFTLSSSAASQLSKSSANTMGTLGIEVLKLVAAGEIQIKVIGIVFSVLTGGYLSIVKKAGPEFMAFLGSKGFKSVGKITQAIKKMKS